MHMHDAYINGNHAQHDTITHTPHEATRAHYTRGAELTIRLQTRTVKSPWTSVRCQLDCGTL